MGEANKSTLRGMVQRFGGTGWGVSRSSWRKLALHVVTSGLVALVLSTVLTKFSGTSLMFPEAWREIVIFVASVLGIMSFEAGNRFRQRPSRVVQPSRATPAVQADGAAGSPEERECPPDSVIRLSWVAMLAMVLSISLFLFLRTECLYHFDPEPWLATQRAAVDADVDRVRPATTRRATTRAESTYLEAAALTGGTAPPLRQAPDQENGNNLDPNENPMKPDFIDAKEKVICIPVVLPRHRAYIEYTRKLRHDDGMRLLLEENPGQVINWLQGDSRIDVMWTTWLFMLDYFACIGSTLFLMGLRFDPIETIWGAILKV